MQWCMFYPVAKDPDHEVKMGQNLVFSILLPFVMHLSGFDLLKVH